MTGSQADALLTTAKKMRKAQRSYFRALSGTVEKTRYLEESRRLESSLDRLIAELDDDRPTLFGDAG